MGNTCKPMAVSFQCMTKFTTKKKKNMTIKKKNKTPEFLLSFPENCRLSHCDPVLRRKAACIFLFDMHGIVPPTHPKIIC